MSLAKEREQLRERYVIALLQAIGSLQQTAADPEVTMELLIEAADLVKQHLQKELEAFRTEQAE